jgi:two-component system response regulator LytT
LIIRVLIIEDDPITCLDLKEILESNGLQVAGTSDTFERGYEVFFNEKPDLLLVDVNLDSQKDGIQLVEQLQKETYLFPVVFLTANSDYETKERAYKTNPAVFLTKPFRESDLINSLELAFHNFSKTQKEKHTKKAFYIKTNHNYSKVMEVDILFIKAEGSYCRIITADREYVISKNLTNCEQELNFDHFIRVHRSYLVNSKKIASVDTQNLYIDGNAIPIGRNYKKSVLEIIHKLS